MTSPNILHITHPCLHTYKVLVWSDVYFFSYWTLKNAPLSSCHVTLDDVMSLKPRTRIARTRVIVHTNFEAISKNFATDISLKFIWDVLPSAARGRCNISWRHRLHFRKAHSCLPLTSLKAIREISPISNYKAFPVTSGFDWKERSRDVTHTITNEDPY